MIPLSKDVDRAEALRRSLAVYRMAFGQCRQDDLVKYLQHYLTVEQINRAVVELRIDLTPTPSTNRNESGVLQSPGDMVGDEEDVPSVCLTDLEDLLDSVAAIRPTATPVSAVVLEQFLDDFGVIVPQRFPAAVTVSTVVLERFLDEFAAIRPPRFMEEL